MQSPRDLHSLEVLDFYPSDEPGSPSLEDPESPSSEEPLEELDPHLPALACSRSPIPPHPPLRPLCILKKQSATKAHDPNSLHGIPTPGP